MLMKPRGDNGHLNQPHYVSREFHSTPHTIHSSNAVTTQNCFAVLSTDDIKDDTSKDSVTEAEWLIDSYYDILIPNHEAETKKPELEFVQTEPMSLQQQLDQYRKKHKERHDTASKIKTDVIVIGDSMIKHIKGHRLSRTKHVRCAAKPGAKIYTIYSHAIGHINQHRPAEVILHIGTNNTRDNAKDIRFSEKPLSQRPTLIR